MTRQPKTPRTRNHRLICDVFGEHQWMPRRQTHEERMFGMWATKFRRLPKGRRAKSGQWWRRTKPAWFGCDWGVEGEDRAVRYVIDEHHDSRRVMEALEKCEPKMRTNA